MLPHGFTVWTMFFISFHPQQISPLEDAQGLKSYPPRPVFQRLLRSIIIMGCKKASWVLNMLWVWLMSFYGSKGGDVFFWQMCFANYFWGRKSQQKCQSFIITNPSHLHPEREMVPHPNKHSGISILLSSKWILILFFVPEEDVNQVWALIKTTMSHPSRKKTET